MDPDRLAAEVARALLEQENAAGPRGPDERDPGPTALPIEAPTATFDEVATRRHIELLTTVLQALTLRGRALARDNVAAIAETPTAPPADAERRLVGAALRVHTLLVEHPVAARALVAALAAEGRRHAATPDGDRLRTQLLRSRMVRRAALLWNSLTMGLIDEGEPTTLPSAYVDVLVELSEHADLERLLGELGKGGRR